MVTLKRADHLHFVDDAEQAHEAYRNSNIANPEIQRDMRPAAKLVSDATAHAFASGLSVAHFDAILRRSASARRFLEVGLKACAIGTRH